MSHNSKIWTGFSHCKLPINLILHSWASLDLSHFNDNLGAAYGNKYGMGDNSLTGKYEYCMLYSCLFIYKTFQSTQILLFICDLLGQSKQHLLDICENMTMNPAFASCLWFTRTINRAFVDCLWFTRTINPAFIGCLWFTWTINPAFVDCLWFTRTINLAFVGCLWFTSQFYL